MCDQVQVSGCLQKTGQKTRAHVSTPRRMDGLFGDSVCSCSKTVGTALVSIHHLSRDVLAFREAGRLSAFLMSSGGICLHTDFPKLLQKFCFSSVQSDCFINPKVSSLN